MLIAALVFIIIAAAVLALAIQRRFEEEDRDAKLRARVQELLMTDSPVTVPFEDGTYWNDQQHCREFRPESKK